MKNEVELIIHGASQVLTMDPDSTPETESEPEARELGLIRNGAVAVQNGLVLDVGESERILDDYVARTVVDASGMVVSPGFVDPHTHLVFAGSRQAEFAMRMRGASYQEILAEGGGIHSTVASTRAAPPADLVAQSEPRLDSLLGFGVTTAEVKSGYGLDVETELKMLRAIAQLSQSHPVRLCPTYLGAHVVPKEYADRRDQYVDLMISKMIPQVAEERLATACDVFLDEGAYTFDEAKAILEAAVAAGLKPKIHAGQFTDKGGPELMAELKGLSADHLEQVSEEGIDAMAEAQVVANLLPGAAFSLRDSFPDGRRFIDRGVAVAVATDDNPGTSRTENLPLMAALAVTQMGLTCAEAWKSITINAAKALDLDEEIGAISPGRCADLTILDVGDFRTFLYHFGVNHTKMVITEGKIALGDQWK